MNVYEHRSVEADRLLQNRRQLLEGSGNLWKKGWKKNLPHSLQCLRGSEGAILAGDSKLSLIPDMVLQQQ